MEHLKLRAPQNQVSPLKKIKETYQQMRLSGTNLFEGWKLMTHRFGQIRPIYWLLCTAGMLAVFLWLMPPEFLGYFWGRLKTHWPLAGMLIVFSLLMLSLLWSAGQRIDARVFMYFNKYGRRSPLIDGMMLVSTQMGNGVFALVVALLFYVRGNHLFAYALGLGTLTLWWVVELIKVLVHRTRPYLKLKNVHIIGPSEPGHSFPSGHTTQSFFIATLLFQYLQIHMIIGILCYSLALSVGITRIYLGMHYPRDVLGGAVLGTVWGLLGVFINSYITGGF